MARRTRIDTAAAHGEPLGEEEVRLTKRAYGWTEDSQVPRSRRGSRAFRRWNRPARCRCTWRWEKLFASYRAHFPALAVEIDQMQRRELPAGWDRNLPSFASDPKGIAGRDASSQVLNQLARTSPGSWAARPTLALQQNDAQICRRRRFRGRDAGRPGTYISAFREHAMAAIVNGLSLSKLRPFGATFFIFSDYARPAIRLSALMELPTILVFTHDAMGDGEDGPTHQPVEHPDLAARHARPGAAAPGDANEVVEAYRYILSCAISRGDRAPRASLADLRSQQYASAAGRGAGGLCDGRFPPAARPKVILIASGSEVSLVVEAHETLASQGIRSRVVSMPSWDIFEHQPISYQESVLPPQVTGASPWSRDPSWVGSAMLSARLGGSIGMKTFGASAPLKELQRKFGFEPERVVATPRSCSDVMTSRAGEVCQDRRLQGEFAASRKRGARQRWRASKIA